MASHTPSPTAAAPPLSCRNLTKRFEREGPPAVDDLTFDVAPASITGFVGANGAGKTTTMRMFLGLVRPTAGTAHIAGHPYCQLDQPRRHVGAVLDGPGAHPSHRARTHLRIVAAGAGLPEDRVDELLDLVGLRDHGKRKVGTFSLGMRQRLALAGALLGDPPILLLDEPVNGLDPSGIVWIRGFLRRLADEGRTILVSSHLLTELAEIADRVAIIDRGRLVAHADLEELAGGRTLEDVYFEIAGRPDDRPGVAATEGRVSR
jgi:ABC-2 type transport system ATP-binding protein